MNANFVQMLQAFHLAAANDNDLQCFFVIAIQVFNYTRLPPT